MPVKTIPIEVKISFGVVATAGVGVLCWVVSLFGWRSVLAGLGLAAGGVILMTALVIIAVHYE